MTDGFRTRRQLVTVTQTRQAEGEGQGAHRMVIAANDVSRNGDQLNLAGMSFENYMKNPVVLWAHDYGVNFLSGATPSGGIPIAKTLEIGHYDGRIVADFEFNSGDDFAARVENAWNGGFIRAASIGYMPTKYKEVEDEKTGRVVYQTEESELLEWSLVPVPADPDSVRAAARALNLPEEIFRGLEPEPAPSETLPEAEPSRELVSQLVRELAADIRDALGLEARDLGRAPENEEDQREPEPAPESSGDDDSILATVGTELAAIRRIIEEM